MTRKRPYAGETDAPPDPTPRAADVANHAANRERVYRARSRLPGLVELDAQERRAERRNREEAAVEHAAALNHPDPVDVMVPQIRTQEVVSAEGEVLREANVTRETWICPDDLDAKRREPKTITGYRTVDPLEKMRRKGSPITARHIRCANKLRSDYAIGVQGAVPGRGSLIKIGSPGFSAGEFATHARLNRLKNVRTVFHLVGQVGTTILMHVVLEQSEGTDPTNLAKLSVRMGQSTQVTLGLLLAALNRLAEFYEPPDTHHTIADKPQPDVVDERIGRVKE